jgi:hypothetical protein
MNLRNRQTEKIKSPPSASKTVLSDIRSFLLHKPEIPSLIKFESESERLNYSQRIMQRLGISVTKYTVLNIHKIGIEAPPRYVFEELLKWNGDSKCWPNHIARVERIDDRIEQIKILPLGLAKYPFGLKKIPFGLNFIPLFNLNAIRIHHLPVSHDFDNARYLLYRCSGGYPIGVFSLYVRSSILEQNEMEQTQLFLIVGFNFYGKEDWSKRNPIHKLWEMVHDRVTANTMNRLKQLCEWRFEKIQAG